MQRKTLTTLNQLRTGDSFMFIKKDQSWRVMVPADKTGKVAVNQVLNGKPIYKYDEIKNGKTQVIFLRHTIPTGGEECFVEDLQPGDVFHRTDDVITEYRLVAKGEHFWEMRNTETNDILRIGKLAVVVFVRHKEAAHV